MNKLNKEYIGESLNKVKTLLESKGYNIIIKKLEPKKDREILDEELVVQVLQKDYNNIVVTTSMFKKYI